VPGRNAPGDELIDLIGVRQKQINQVFIDGARLRDSTVECGDTLRSSEAPQKKSHSRIFEASFFRRCRFFPIDSLAVMHQQSSEKANCPLRCVRL
jgi:hypothetical protein